MLSAHWNLHTVAVKQYHPKQLISTMYSGHVNTTSLMRGLELRNPIREKKMFSDEY